jgi:hypothetical protein
MQTDDVLSSHVGSRYPKARIPRIFYACVLLALGALVGFAWKVRLVTVFPSNATATSIARPASAAGALLRGESTRNDSTRIQASRTMHGMLCPATY